MARRVQIGAVATPATPGRVFAVTLIALGCAAAIAACGGSSSKSTTLNADYSKAVKFASCMRAHGVPNFPDPVAGGGFSFPITAGFKPFSPAATAAQKDCHALMPQGGKGPGEATAQQKAQTLALATCMRAHGVTGFPDPIGALPPGGGNYSMVFGQPGNFLAVPSTINIQSPAFTQAATACDFPGFGSKH